MEKELIWRMIKSLEEISSKLDKIIYYLKISQENTLKNKIKSVLGHSKLRKKIYELCDGKHTVKDIASVLGKSIQHISIELSRMEKEGIVRIDKVGRRRFYIKIMEV